MPRKLTVASIRAYDRKTHEEYGERIKQCFACVLLAEIDRLKCRLAK